VRFQASLLGSILAAALLPSAGTAATETTAVAPVPPAHELISVSNCNPQLNYRQSGGFYGYAPGPWPGGYWPDAYGYRYYQPPVATTLPQLGIDYRNITPKTMHSIEFGLIANGRLVAEVKDVGTFTQNAEIKHTFALNPNVFPLQTGLPQCVPLRIIFADGTKWRNPMLPPKNQHIYINR
jgi:hypothetical protein